MIFLIFIFNPNRHLNSFTYMHYCYYKQRSELFTMGEWSNEYLPLSRPFRGFITSGKLDVTDGDLVWRCGGRVREGRYWSLSQQTKQKDEQPLWGEDRVAPDHCPLVFLSHSLHYAEEPLLTPSSSRTLRLFSSLKCVQGRNISHILHRSYKYVVSLQTPSRL